MTKSCQPNHFIRTATAKFDADLRLLRSGSFSSPRRPLIWLRAPLSYVQVTQLDAFLLIITRSQHRPILCLLERKAHLSLEPRARGVSVAAKKQVHTSW